MYVTVPVPETSGLDIERIVHSHRDTSELTIHIYTPIYVLHVGYSAIASNSGEVAALPLK